MKFLPKYTNRDSLSVIKYLNDIYKIPLLTCEEEIELGLKAKEGDEKAIEKLVKSNLRFVISIAKQYQTPQHDLSTLISEGNLGLIKAAQKFDPTKGFKFLSYAVWWIRQSIQDWIYNKGKIIQLPFPKGLLLKNVKKEINRFNILHSRDPTLKELSNILNIDEISILTVLDYMNNLVFLNDVIGQDNQNFYDIVEDTKINSPDNNLLQESFNYDIVKALNSLPKNYGEIIKLIYGINCESISMKEIGKKFNLCEERIKQIHRLCLKQLKENKKYDFLKTYL